MSKLLRERGRFGRKREKYFYFYFSRPPPPTRAIIPDNPLGTFENQDVAVTVRRGISKRSHEKIGDCEQSKASKSTLYGFSPGTDLNGNVDHIGNQQKMIEPELF